MPDWRAILVKRLKTHRFGIAAFVLIVFAGVVRIYAIAQGWPATNSDEATLTLEARHIAFLGEHPIFLYGQNYMGTIEAYLGALLMHIFSTPLFSIRLGLILLFALFLGCIYFLTSLLYSKRLALFSLLLLSIGSDDLLTREVKALGGSLETLLFGSILMLLASWLALTSYPSGQETVTSSTRQRQRWRYAAYAGWGLAAGLGLWSHMLIGPFILAGGLLLVAFCRHELRLRARTLQCLIVGLVIGAFPLIYYNLTAPFSQNSLVTLWNLNRGTSIQSPNHFSFLQQVVGTLLISIPVSTGHSPACTQSQLPLFGQATSNTLSCTIVQATWGLGYLVLLTIAIIFSIAILKRLRRLHQSSSQTWDFKARQTAILQFARLMLLSTAVITILLYVISPVAAFAPWPTSRYLVGQLVSIPAVIWPLWNGISRGEIYRALGWIKGQTTGNEPVQDTRSWGKGAINLAPTIFKCAMLVIVSIVFILGTINLFTKQIPSVEAINQQQDRFVHDLIRAGATRIYADYWTCDRVVLQSNERILCSALDNNLNPVNNRYTAYSTAVQADPNAAYVLPDGSPQALAFAQRIAQSGRHYKYSSFDGFVIYQPEIASASQGASG
jgi:hypothetical protein